MKFQKCVYSGWSVRALGGGGSVLGPQPMGN